MICNNDLVGEVTTMLNQTKNFLENAVHRIKP